MALPHLPSGIALPHRAKVYYPEDQHRTEVGDTDVVYAAETTISVYLDGSTRSIRRHVTDSDPGSENCLRRRTIAGSKGRTMTELNEVA